MAPLAVPEALAAIWVAAVGAVVGSFLNVVVARIPAGESVVRPPSRCPRCLTPIRWYDNVPILSWIVLRARCRACGARISARYPLVEAAGAALGLLAFARHGLSGAAAAELAYAGALVVLALIDLDTWLLPNAITWPLIAFGVAMGGVGASPAGTLKVAAYGAGIGFAVFALLSVVGERVFKKEALGFGDVWLLAGLGAWQGPKALLPIVLLASLQGSIVGVALIVMGKAEKGPGPEEAAPLPGPLPAARGEGERGGRGEGKPFGSGEPTPLPSPLPAARGEGEAKEPTVLGGEETVRNGEGTSSESVSTTEADWIPPRHAVPFGPFLVAGALEWLYLGALIARAVPPLALFR